MPSRPVRQITAAAILLLSLAPALDAQSLRGRVLEEGGARPVQGALVVLLDEGDAVRAGALSGEDGGWVMETAVPAGRFRVRAQRIGYADAYGSYFQLGGGASPAELTLTMRARAVELEGISVQARRRCTVRHADGQVVARLWDEARKALQAAAFTEGERMFGFDVRTHLRVLDPATLRVVRDSTAARQGHSDRSPFVSLPVERLLTEGFIRPDASGSVYHAPDAHALLSDEFAAAYCWGVRDSHPQEPGLVGITFEPAARLGPPAVRGTLWLDRRSAELRWLEYGYTRVQSPFDGHHHVGGRVEFEALPSGAWIVRRWWIRMPSGRPVHSLANPSGRTSEPFRSLVEDGGEVVEIRSAGGARRRAAGGGVVEGVVFDSTRAAPLAGALVFVSGTSHSDTTDAAGRYRIELPQGRYELSFSHPDLRRAGVMPGGRAVEVRQGGELAVELGVPRTARRDAALERCPAVAAGANRGVLAGRVVDGVTRGGIARARVGVSWGGDPAATAAADRPGQQAVAAAADGSFLICGLPADRPLEVAASALGRRGEALVLEGLGELAFAERELPVGLTEAQTLTLTLRDEDSRQPVTDAVVSLPELGRTAASDRAGRVSFEGLAPGPHTVEVRHLAYGTQRERLVVELGQPELEMRLSARAIAIAGIEVVARSAAAQARRRSGARQTLMLRPQIEEAQITSRNLGDLARRIPGLRVNDIRDLNSSIQTELCIQSGRGPTRDQIGACPEPVLVILDGRPIFDTGDLVHINLAHLESIEYLSSAEAGGRYGMGSANGVLLLFTRGNGPYATRAR
jgi:hypothetical protein